jgi:putative membrane protein
MRSTDTIFVSVLTLVSALAIGCNRDTTDAGQSDAKSKTEPGAATPASGQAGGQAGAQAGSQGSPAAGQLTEEGREFIMTASQDGLLEVEAGRLAEKNAQTESVRQFARKMVEHHGKANEELAQVAKSKNLQVPTALVEAGQDRLDKLRDKTGRELDQEYMDMMVDEHQKAIRRFERQAERDEDPEVGQWATKTLPTLRSHLDEAKRIEDTLDDQPTSAAQSPGGMDSPSGMGGGDTKTGGGDTKTGGGDTKTGGGDTKTGDTKTGGGGTKKGGTGDTKTGGTDTKKGGTGDTKSPDTKQPDAAGSPGTPE